MKKFLSKPLVLIGMFVFFTFFRNFATFSKWGSYFFGDTAMYSLYVAGLASNIETLFSFKNNYLFWNTSYLSVGLPTLSIVDLGVLYPVNIVIAILARLSGDVMNVYPLYTLSIFLHLIFGSYFVYKLLIEYFKVDKYAGLFGAFLWIFAGFNLEFMGAAGIMLTASYLPICMYLKTQKSLRTHYLYFIFLALSFLAGYPIIALSIMTYCIVFALFLKYDWKKELLGLFLITFPIISPLYLTTAINFSLNIRSAINVEGFLSNAAVLSSITEALLPKNTIFNSENKTNLVYMYFSLVGLLVLLQSKDKVMILKNRINVFFIISGVAGLILSLGGVTIVPVLSYFLIPAFSFFRRLSVFVLLPQFAFCLLIPQFINLAINNDKLTKSSEFMIKLITIIFLTPAFLFLTDLVGKSSFEKFYLSFSSVVIVVFLVYLGFYLQTNFKKLGLAILIFALYLEASNLVLSKIYLNSEVNPKLIFAPNRLTTKLKEIIKPSERVELSSTQHSYSTDYMNIEQTTGYVSLASAYGVRINEKLNSPVEQNNLRDILGIKYVLKQELKGSNATKLYTFLQNKRTPDFYVYDYVSYKWVPEDSKTNFSIFQRNTALDRLFFASSVTPKTQNENILTDIQDNKNPKDVFVNPANLKDVVVSDEGKIEMVDYSRNYIKARVTSLGETFVANSTGYYPGWWAKIDGNWVRPIQTNWFMMGTYLPNGTHTLEYVYVPYGFILGILYILGACVAWGVLKKHEKYI